MAPLLSTGLPGYIYNFVMASYEEYYLRTKRAKNGQLGYATIDVRTSMKKNSDEKGKEKNLASQAVISLL